MKLNIMVTGKGSHSRLHSDFLRKFLHCFALLSPRLSFLSRSISTSARSPDKP